MIRMPPDYASGDVLTEWMVIYGLKRRWYEFDFLARRRLIKHIKKERFIMNAREFNRCYVVGSRFIFQSRKVGRDSKLVKTIGIARDLQSATVVEINVEPYFANINSLTPAG